MKKLIDYLIKKPSVQKRLKELGWTPPKVEPKGGGPTNPPKPV